MIKIEYKLSDIEKIIPDIVKNFKSNIILLDGQMGSGKTTLIKQIVKYLGSGDDVLSPTFSIVNEYLLNDNRRVYHFDLYRLNDEYEALDFGIEEYFSDTGAYIFIEWFEKIINLIPENSQKIRIIVKNSDTRILEIF